MSCIFKNCSNTKYFCKGSGIRFFHLPTIPYMRQKWLASCNRIEEELPKFPFVCSIHFDQKDIILDKYNRWLNKNAVPVSYRYQSVNGESVVDIENTNDGKQVKMAELDKETLQNELEKKRICRFCLSQDEALLTNIFHRDTRIKSSAPFHIQVMTIASIEVFSNDGMPSYVCSDCISIFEYSYQFKQMCKAADNLLRQYPFVGKWPSCLKKPVMSQTLPTMPIQRTTHTKDQLSLPKKILNTNVEESKSRKNTFIEEFVRKVDKVDDELSITYMEKIDNNDELSLDDIQLLVASEDVAEAESINIENSPVIDINCGSKTTKPKLLNKSSVRILNKEAVPENEPRLTPKPKTNKNQDGNMEKVAEILNIDDKYGEEPDPTKAEPVETNIFPCPKCERTFPLVQLRDLHMKSHLRTRNFHCDKCSKSFVSKYGLKNHLHTHKDKKPFACSACGKSFLRSTHLTRHETTHTDIPKHICVHCERPFISNEDMQRHAKRHNINRPFKCKFCNKGFAFKQGLDRHEDTHSPQQPFSCQYCDKSFSTPSKLERHLKAHAGLRPYPCRFCKKSYLKSHHLRRHLRSHKYVNENADDIDFMCSTCKTSFKSRDELIQHSKIHADDHNLDCPLCKEIFDSTKALTAHIQNHSEGEAYACEFCDLIFITAENLQMHTDLEHAQEMEAYHEDDRAQPNKMNTETMKIEIEDEKLQYTVNEFPPDEHLDDGAQANKNRETLKDDIEDEKLLNNVNEFLLDENSDDGNDSNNSLKTISKNDQELSPKIIHQIIIQSKNGPMNSVEYKTNIAEDENLLIPLKQCKIDASEKDVTTAVSSKPSTQLKRKIANTARPTRDANQPTIQSSLKMPKSNTEIKSEAIPPENKPCVIKVESDASTSLSSSTEKVKENQNLVKGGKEKKSAEDKSN